MVMREDRTNEAWLRALSGTPQPDSLDDLRARLMSGLRYALQQRYSVTESDLEDFTQEALVKILANLDSFRGESKFTTWAQKIAIRVAFSELRRKRWENISLEDLAPSWVSEHDAEALALLWLPSTEPSPERRVTRQSLRTVLAYLIEEELTELQRQAMVAIVLRGMPIEEVARRLDTNRNALYKLLHDARQRLKRSLEAQGLTVEEVLAAFAPE
jgi:RNA polymerase sigma-70 factor, ECF subfamily